jgi:hypothetical protein
LGLYIYFLAAERMQPKTKFSFQVHCIQSVILYKTFVFCIRDVLSKSRVKCPDWTGETWQYLANVDNALTISCAKGTQDSLSISLTQFTTVFMYSYVIRAANLRSIEWRM